MNRNGLLRRLTIFIIVLLNIGCDQVTKNLVRTQVAYHEQIKIITDRVTLTKVENSGAFLSLGDSLDGVVKFVLLLLMPAVVLLLALYYVLSKRDLDKITMVAICCVVGGGVGNLYDRIVHGAVTDFLHIDFGLFQTGVFNIADMSIMFGMLIILFKSIVRKQPEDNVYV